MRRYYGIYKLKCNRLIQEQLTRLRYLIQMHIKTCARVNYKNLIHNENEKINIPKNIIFKPTNIIIYDLLPKYELNKFIIGWRRLSKKYSKVKFTNNPSEKDVFSYIKGLRDNLSSKSWQDTGTFNISRKFKDFNNFNLRIYNFSVSMCMLRFNLQLSNVFRDKIIRLFKSKCGNPLIEVSHTYYGKHRIQHLAASTSIDIIKNRDWHEFIAIEKWSFLNFVCRILKLKLLFFSNNIQSPNILMINTSIKRLLSIRPSSGKDYIRHLNYYKNDFYFKSATDFDKSYKIDSNQRMCVNYQPYYDIQYFYDSRYIKFNGKIIDKNIGLLLMKEGDLLDYAGELLCLNISNNVRRRYTYKYVINTNKIKMKWHKYSNILMVRFNYRTNISPFNVIKDEINWDLLVYHFKMKWHDNNISTKYPEILINSVHISNILDNVISKENIYVDNKITLLKDLSEEKQNHKSSIFIFTILAFIVSILALISSLGSLNLSVLKNNIIIMGKIVEGLWK